MADFIDFNNATFDGGDGNGGGEEMLFDDIFGVNGGNGAGDKGFATPQVERQAVIFLIDCSVSMFAPQAGATTTSTGGNTTYYHTPFSKAVKFARDFCQQKVFSSDKDLTAVILYNSMKPLNQYQFPSIFVFQEFNSPSAPQVQELDTLSRAGIFIQTGHKSGGADGGAGGPSRFNAHTYEDFRTMIGHADADMGGNAGGQTILRNPITGAPVQNSAVANPATGGKAAALSEVLWTCQHLFHFLRSNSNSNYVFTKHVMVFTDKENPVAAYAARAAPAKVRSATTGNAPPAQSKQHEVMKRVLLEYERAESRIRDLHEDGVTVEVFGYTEDPRSTNNDNTATAATATTTASGTKFNGKTFWGKFLNGPKGDLLSEELRRALRAGGSLPGGVGKPPSGSNKDSPSGGTGPLSNSAPLTNSYSLNPYQLPNSGPSVGPTSALTPVTPAQQVDWFSTLPRAAGGSNTGSQDGSNPKSNHLHGSSTDGVASSYSADDLQNLPAGTLKVALGRVYALPRPGPEGKEKQGLHRQLDANLGGTADAQEELEQQLLTESMMMKSASVRQHATRSVGSLLVSFGNGPPSQSAASTTTPTMAVKVYRPIVPLAKPRFSWRHSRTNEVLITKTAYIDNATGQEVADPTKTAAAASASSKTLTYFADVAGERAVFSAEEKQQIRTGTFVQHPTPPTLHPDGSSTSNDDPPGIKVIGFKPYHEAVKLKYSLNRAVFIHPFATSSAAADPNVKFFVGLHRTLTQRKLVAIAEMVSRRSGAPAMVALVPSIVPTASDMAASLTPNSATQGSTLSSGGTTHGMPPGYLQGALAIDGCGFHIITLPYTDDIRSLSTFKRFAVTNPPMPTDDLITKSKKIIQKLSVTYFPEAITNPTLAHQYRQLQRLALGNDEFGDMDGDSDSTDSDDGAGLGNSTLTAQDQLRKKRRRIQDAFDVTLPHKEGMSTFKGLFDAFNKAAFPLGYLPEAYAPVPKAKAPGPSKDEVEQIDWDGLLAADKIGSLTMPPLQAFLKLHGLSNSGKKAELVERVKATLKKLALKKAGGQPANAAHGIVKSEPQ